MNVTAKIDRPKLEKALKKYAKQFGDTSAQAVIRWSVQTCREMAFETQPWGRKGTRKTQQTAMERDLGRVVAVVENPPKKQGDNYVRDPAEAIAWMNENRIRNNRTRKLPIERRKKCTLVVFKKTISVLMQNAGIAKGGFIGAGNEIAEAQRGNEKVTIGKGFFSYARKHSKFGSAQKPRTGFRPQATINNKARHTGIEYVLKKTAIRKAVDFGLKKTVKWYQKTLNAIDKKQKP